MIQLKIYNFINYLSSLHLIQTMHAVLQISAGGPYPAPINTSKHLYWRVWMSSVKRWNYKNQKFHIEHVIYRVFATNL